MRADFSDPFLRNLDEATHATIEARRDDWGLTRSEFYPRLEKWFANFSDRDKELALKIFLHLDYYSAHRFARRIDDLKMPVLQFLNEVGGTIADLLLVVPDPRGDSADRHAYEVIKAWGLEQRQIVTISSLTDARADNVLVFFNDTHGTGNQFVREAAANVDADRVRAMFIIGIAIADKALRRFKSEFPRATVLPGRPTSSVRDLFTTNEVRRIRELGRLVYRTHPMGYGDSGLLTAYQFQCPNNTLPLIWADSESGNNAVDGLAYPWSPLQAYVPKVKRPAPAPASQPPAPPAAALLDPSHRWQWTPDELTRLVDHIASWGLSTPSFYERAGRWLDNFRPNERKLALDVFLKTTYLDVRKTRQGIDRLGRKIFPDIKAAGGDRADIVLVTTGDQKDSVYHYVFDFLREWRLDVDQVIDIERLSPDMAIDKTLVLFYHTRSGDHFARASRTGPSHAERIAELRPRTTFMASYAMTPAARAALRPWRPVYLEDVSGTVADMIPHHADSISALEHALDPAGTRPPGEELLLAYYFQCPKSSSRLLWADQPERPDRRGWQPLFRNIEIPK